MAYAFDQSFITLQAADNLTAYRYRVMRISGENLCNVASNVAANTAFGILDNDPTSGQAARVAVAGVTKVYSGGTVTAGLLLTHNSSAQVLNATSGQLVVGRALQTGVAGDLVSVFIQPAFFAAVAV
jgi:hypothetical protein